MNYCIRTANNKDKEFIFECKLSTVTSGQDITNSELERFKKYINNNLLEHLKDYRVITDNNKIIGLFCYYLVDDSYLLDEIYIIDEYRNKGIGTDIIKDIIKTIEKEHKNICLWVYKENIKAIALYKRFNFKIIEETDTRYKMMYSIE